MSAAHPPFPFKDDDSVFHKTQPGVLPVFQSRSQTKAFYNRISKFYDLLAYHSEARVRRIALARLASRSGEKILEIGFGTGHCLTEIAKVVGVTGKVYGVDLSEEMMKRGKKLLEKQNLAKRGELVCSDAIDLPYQHNFLDAIFMSFTLELFDTPEIPKVLLECMRVLRPSGRIVVAGLSKEGRQTLFIKAFEWTHQHFPKFLDCRPIYVRRALADAGFKITEISRKQMWLPVEIVLGIKPI